jgi:hypothetical protein
LKLRVPWWAEEPPTVTINGKRQENAAPASSYVTLNRTWEDDTVLVILPKSLTVCPLPDAPDVVAFMDGPAVLAGLCGREQTLLGDKDAPDQLLIPDNDGGDWTEWSRGYRTRDQSRGIRFIPLYEVQDEPYTVYFPIKPAG